MSLINILSRLQDADPEFEQRISPRRHLIKNAARATALTALPLALGGLLKRAYSQTNPTMRDVLETALLAERLEVAFYNGGLNASGLSIPAQDRNELSLIRDNETAHLALVSQTFQSLYGSLPAAPTFDFTGGNGSGTGLFSDWNTSYVTFLAMAQTFETNGVRAYKGGAAILLAANKDVLQAALNIHSVEARHAAHLMMMRKRNGHATDIKPWLTGTDPKIPDAAKRDAVAGVYAGEEATSQANVNIVGIGGKDISTDDATEAFDEPITIAQARANADPFVV